MGGNHLDHKVLCFAESPAVFGANWPDTPSGTRQILSDTSTPLFSDFVYSPRSGGFNLRPCVPILPTRLDSPLEHVPIEQAFCVAIFKVRRNQSLGDVRML